MNTKCFYCGSKDFRADRALAGKLICIRCGRPISNVNNFRKSLNINRSNNFLIIFIITILFIIIII